MVMVQIISPDEATLRRGKPPVKPFRSHRSLELALLFCLLLIVPYGTYAWDPYEVLGVERSANLDQIKSAYRALARKLHPDKSDLSEDDVGVKFIELNKAFNILKDPEKRSRFDRHGEIEDNRSRGFRERDSPRRHARENWTQNGFRTFTFYSSDGSLRRKSITSSQYYNRILRDSSSKIYFIFFYASFCPSCSMIESTWTKITDELAKFNIGSVTINVDHEPRLARDSGVSSIPYIACLVNGELRHYNLPELSLTDTVKFARQSLPSGLIVPLKTEYDQDRFVSSSLQQNRRAVIVINSEETLKLRFHLLAFELAHYYKFGHIDIKSHEHALFMKKFNLKIKPQICHILVFDEDLEKPRLLSSQESSVLIDYNKLRKDLTRWPYLKLPKLSTQQRFNDLCVHTIPKDGDKVRPRLCVILFTSTSPSTLTMRNKLIEFIRLNNLEQNERVVFAMIDPSKQAEFVSSLLDETKALYPFSGQEIDSSIILLERHHHDSRKARYLWLKYRWTSENLDELDRAKLSLHHLVQQYKQYPSLLENKVVLRNLVDEEGPGLFSRIVWRLVNSILRLTNYVTQRESVATVMVLFSCALITSLYLYKPLSSMASGINQEAFETKFQSSPASSDIHANSQHEYNSASDGELKILELRAETYNGMVRLLKPGYRSIILLVDNETRDKLLPYFRKAVWPYRRNKTLLFGYLCLDKNITWYKSLLRQVTGIEDLNVNKKNCIGTVLSLNGFRKYLRVYHAKHHEIDRYDIDIDTDGSFFGTEDDGDDIESCTVTSSISDSRCESLCTVDNLLERLPIWLDKMFDGLTKRYFIDNWPEDIN